MSNRRLLSDSEISEKLKATYGEKVADLFDWAVEDTQEITFDHSICGAHIESWSAEGPELVFDFKTESGKFRKVKELKKVLRQYQAQMPYTPVTLTVVFN